MNADTHVQDCAAPEDQMERGEVWEGAEAASSLPPGGGDASKQASPACGSGGDVDAAVAETAAAAWPVRASLLKGTPGTSGGVRREGSIPVPIGTDYQVSSLPPYEGGQDGRDAEANEPLLLSTQQVESEMMQAQRPSRAPTGGAAEGDGSDSGSIEEPPPKKKKPLAIAAPVASADATEPLADEPSTAGEGSEGDAERVRPPSAVVAETTIAPAATSVSAWAALIASKRKAGN